MFYSYAEKQGDGFFGTWQLRQVAFDTMRRYLYYSEPARDAFPITNSEAASSTTTPPPTMTPSASAGAADRISSANVSTSSQPSSATERGTTPAASAAAAAATTVSAENSPSPSKLVWKKKMKVTAVVPVATRPNFVHRTANERDLYQLEIKGESRPLATGEYPPAGPLLCPSAGLSTLERARCNANNESYIRDPFFLKELFDSLRDHFDEMTKAKVRAAAAAADADPSTNNSNTGRGSNTNLSDAAEAVDFGVQTLVSPRRHKTEAGASEAAVVPVRVILRCRDEREFRRLWYVLQSVLGYDKLIVRPYRGLPPYDPRNGVAFAHIPMGVWHTFHSLDKAVFYTFMRGNFYALESSGSGETSFNSSRGSRAQAVTVPRLKRVLEGAYLCITHDSVLCMRESGNIPRWLRLAEVQEFHWNVASVSEKTNTRAPFCVFLSDAPIPDLFFEPTAPAYGADAIASYDPLVDVRRTARVIHDTCFASFSTRRVIRIKEVHDTSMEAYVARTVREATRLPALQTGSDYNSTLSCPLPKEQLAVVWQQVQSELLERGNMANRAAIPIYRTNARDVELSEDQLSTVERELDDVRERRDDVVGMPIERARQLERRRRAAMAGGNAQRTRPRHRDAHAAGQSTAVTGAGGSGVTHAGQRRAGAAHTTAPADGAAAGETTTTTATTTQVMPLTMELLQTPQLQGRFATSVDQLQSQQQSPHPQQHHGAASRSGVGSKSERSYRSSQDESTLAASEYSSYLVPGARYLTQEEWQSGGYAATGSPVSAVPDANATPAAAAGAPATAVPTSGAATLPSSAGALPVPIPVPTSTKDSGHNASKSSPLAAQTTATSSASRTPVASSHRGSGGSGSTLKVSRGGSAEKTAAAAPRGGTTTAGRHSYAEERTVNEIVGRSMAALDGSRVDLDQMDKKK